MTAKQQAFIDAYVLGASARGSALDAGYSEKYANQATARLLRNPEVQVAIRERLAQVEKSKVMSVQEALEETTELARNGITRHKLPALKLILRYHGVLVNRHEIGGRRECSDWTDQELDAEIHRMLAKRTAAGAG